MAIPIIVLEAASSASAGLLTTPLLLMILFRQKYPRWWFDWNLGLLQFWSRVSVYVLLMRDEYPSTENEQAVHLEMAYPDAREELGRFMQLFKWLLAIPHYIALAFLAVAVLAVSIYAWFAILVTGKHPKGAFEFVEGSMRWVNRVISYAFIMTTDQYPPFRLKE
ncbi:MAG TPA: DUF4389 domain-containing protein [SAR202 cluster bacterium]|nr:DUF4389 domain-containing protein [SAR202 cluster bacterium]